MLILEVAIGVALGIVIAALVLRNLQELQTYFLDEFASKFARVIKVTFTVVMLIVFLKLSGWGSQFYNSWIAANKFEDYFALFFTIPLCVGLVALTGNYFKWVVVGKWNRKWADESSFEFFYAALLFLFAIVMYWLTEFFNSDISGSLVVILCLFVASATRYFHNKKIVP